MAFTQYGKSTPYGAGGYADRTPTRTIDQLMGRQLSPTPEHLDRAVYIPYHRRHTTHLPLYNVSESYKKALGDVCVGGYEYKTRLCLMRKPTANTADVDVRYLVDLKDEGREICVRERRPNGDWEAKVSLPADKDAEVHIQDEAHNADLTMAPSYPLPAKATKKAIIEYPYFSLSSINEKDLAHYEWRIHPVEQGGLCYTLVDTRILSRTGNRQDATRAIYHHAGMEEDLPSRYSEGILLLSNRKDSLPDLTVVASLMALLNHVLNRERVIPEKRSLMSRLGVFFSRCWTRKS